MTEELVRDIQSRHNSQKAAWWENYVKGSAPFLGVPMAELRIIIKAHAPLSFDDAMALIEGRYSEYKLSGILVLAESEPRIAIKDRLERLARLFDEGHIYDWNITDWFSIKAIGSAIEDENIEEHISKWHTAENLWRARASIVSFAYVKTRPLELIRISAAHIIKREERFAKTAVGWILREISRDNPDFVEDFIATYGDHISKEALRNATKYMP